MSTIHYGCTALIGTNKAGVLKPDENGRYDMILGALEYPNSVDDIYTLSSAEKHFKEGTSLRRRIDNGQLRGELGHPKRYPGMSDDEFLQRILTIDENNVSHHISDVFIDHYSVKDPKTGRNVITFRGKVRPCGEKGHILKDMLDDPNQNVAFSVRSLTMNKRVGFRYHRDFTQIITWDYVNEPGLAPANKYGVPSLESYDDDDDIGLNISVESVTGLINRNQRSGVSLESNTLLAELKEALLAQEKPREFTW